MGLKKTNYEIADIGVTLETAYAIIHRLEIIGTKGVAEFYIQKEPRANALSLKPLKRQIVRFNVKRSENPFVTAYETAKGTYTALEYNHETHKTEEVEKPMPFNGWEDDIVVETEEPNIDMMV